jgi:hypothetical protein
MQKQSAAHYIAKALVDLLFFGGIVCVMLVPWLSKYVSIFGYGEKERWIIAAVLITSGICAVYILFNLKQMFKTLLGGNPFVEKNISSFRKMAVSCAMISLIYLVKSVFIFTLATIIIILMFAVGSLFCLTLKDIFKQAMFYKEEHDWTV